MLICCISLRRRPNRLKTRIHAKGTGIDPNLFPSFVRIPSCAEVTASRTNVGQRKQRRAVEADTDHRALSPPAPFGLIVAHPGAGALHAQVSRIIDARFAKLALGSRRDVAVCSSAGGIDRAIR